MKLKRNLAITLLATAVAVAACGDDKGGETSSVHPSQKDRVAAVEAATGDPVEVFLDSLEAFNESNLEDLLATYTADTVWHQPCAPRPPARGRKAVARQLVGFKGMLPDTRIGVRRILEQGDLLVAQAVLTATQKWDKQGIERKEPKRVGYEMLYFVQAANGPAAATLLYFDLATGRRQLGHMKGEVPPVVKLPRGDPEILRDAPAADNEKATREFFEILEKGDLAGIDALVAEGFAFRDVDEPGTLNLGAFRERHAKRTANLSEVSYKVREVVTAGDFAAAHWVMKGVQGANDEAPAKRLKLHGAHVLEFADGKLSRVEAYDSEMERIEQLGLVDSFRKPADALLPPVDPEAGKDAGAPEPDKTAPDSK